MLQLSLLQDIGKAVINVEAGRDQVKEALTRYQDLK
jgi:hypothetical protein